MTLNDFMKRIDLGKDKDKMLLWSDGIGWTNVEIKKDNCCIMLLPYKKTLRLLVINNV